MGIVNPPHVRLSFQLSPKYFLGSKNKFLLRWATISGCLINPWLMPLTAVINMLEINHKFFMFQSNCRSVMFQVRVKFTYWVLFYPPSSSGTWMVRDLVVVPERTRIITVLSQSFSWSPYVCLHLPNRTRPMMLLPHLSQKSPHVSSSPQSGGHAQQLVPRALGTNDKGLSWWAQSSWPPSSQRCVTIQACAAPLRSPSPGSANQECPPTSSRPPSLIFTSPFDLGINSTSPRKPSRLPLCILLNKRGTGILLGVPRWPYFYSVHCKYHIVG